MDEIIKSNRVKMIGEIISCSYSHEKFNQRFYMAELKIKRFSEVYDTIPVMISEKLYSDPQTLIGRYVRITGQYRSYDRHLDEETHLILSVYVQDLEVISKEEYEECKDEKFITNQVFLDGFICKEPVYRKTPAGKEITDILLALNRPYGKSDYIPCIVWQENAEKAATLTVGSRCMLWGRIQSREYVKKYDDDKEELKTAYEVSVGKFEEVTES